MQKMGAKTKKGNVVIGKVSLLLEASSYRTRRGK
jgi:hypothetical protein